MWVLWKVLFFIYSIENLEILAKKSNFSLKNRAVYLENLVFQYDASVLERNNC
jgi:hypothetical protein